MKKILITAMTLFVGLIFGQESPIGFNQLPKNAQSFVNKYFGKGVVSTVIRDKEVSKIDYKVIMKDGTKITFDGRGNWDDVETKGYSVPVALIPISIRNYVAQNYKGIQIVGIDKESYKYKIELSNGMDLEFNKQGKFIKIGD